MGGLGKPHVEGCCPCRWGDWVSPMWRDAVLALHMGGGGGLGKPHVEGCCPCLAYGGGGLGKPHVEGCCPCLVYGCDWVSPMWRDAVITLYMGRLGKPHVEGCCPYLVYGATG